MITGLDEGVRRLVPRWRESTVALATRELDPLDARPRLALEGAQAADIEERVDAWRRNRTIGTAADLVATAVALARELPEAATAAKWILDTNAKLPAGARELARVLLGEQQAHLELEAVHALPPRVDPEMRRLRRLVRSNLDNPIAWIDLARLHASGGRNELAMRAAIVAADLAPDNRLVLRSAARMMVHGEEPDRGLAIIRRARSLRRDPWLLAAEVAVGAVCGVAPRNAKQLRELLESRDIAPIHLSELAGAMGSLELDAGSNRAARKLFRQALEDPSENAVAQAKWVSRALPDVAVLPEHLERPFSFEARAVDSYQEGRWKDAVDESFRWLRDEPFSARPAVFGSFAASVTASDYESATRLAVAGLHANPDDQTLLNNAAFAYASAGNVEKAEVYHRRMKIGHEDGDTQVVWLATAGLIAMRRGEVEDGRVLYKAAIAEATANGNVTQVALASLYLAREEMLCGSDEAPAMLSSAIETAGRDRSPAVRQAAEVVRQELLEHTREGKESRTK